MSVVITIVILAAFGLWAVAAYNRLLRLRHQVKRQWNELDGRLKRRGETAGASETSKELELELARNIYNNAVVKYNDALRVFPANILGGFAGLHVAKKFERS